jgi:hypothetical protein
MAMYNSDLGGLGEFVCESVDISPEDRKVVQHLHDILHLVYDVPLHDENLKMARKTIARMKFSEGENSGE